MSEEITQQITIGAGCGMDELLAFLLTGKPTAEDDLCRALRLTRAELAKNADALESKGYRIDRAGLWQLTPHWGSLLPGDIRAELQTARYGRGEILYAPEMGSTNTELKQAAALNVLPEGSLAICDRQTQGKGRLNRVWEDTGAETALTSSLLLRPTLPPERVPLLTLAVALAAAEAIGSYGPDAKIKWPNDVVIGTRKCVGILCETVTDPAGERCVVAGAGFNVNQPSFPEALQNKATSLLMEGGAPVNRRELLCRYLLAMERSMRLLETNDLQGFFSEYAERSVTLGSRVEVIGVNERFTGIAERVDETGALWVRPDGGEPRRVLSGDVSVRGVMGYV